MQEERIINTIKSIIGDKYIGDDCAYIKDLGIVVSQDSLVEDVHFSLDYMTPYELGYKSGKVNISDIAASGGRCKYMTVALSLPKTISTDFVKEFYKGLVDAIGDVEIIGGDITGSDKVMVSITVIGTDKDRRISSRSHAKEGYVIVTNGEHGSSAGGLRLLQAKNPISKPLIEAHLKPAVDLKMSETIAKNIKENYAMMDSSDGLADVLFKIATSSRVSIVLDFDKVEYNPDFKKLFPNDYKNMVLFGGEDYKTVAAVPKDFALQHDFKIIGSIIPKTDVPLKVINWGNGSLDITNLEKCYNHFSK